MFIISIGKNIIIKIRSSVRFLVLAIIGLLLIGCAFIYIFRPIYSVTLNGEFLGYSENKAALQAKINEYIENGEGENIAFVQIDEFPKYEMCLLKKNIVANDEEIFEKVKETGTTYYEYYTITLNGEEKAALAQYDDAQKVIDELKKKESNNIDKLGVVKKYEVALADFSDTETVVNDLYEKKPVVKTKSYTSSYSSYTKTVNNTGNKVQLGMALLEPTNGVITSRFGYRRTSFHTGLDIANSTGTTIKAAASGTVSFAGTTTSGYGKYIVINHGNGIETYYAHCSQLYVSAGQSVSAGQHIAAMGSTGNSTGPHLHFEVRVNGSCQNPQNYVF